jgi:signal transduction histidine kinase
VAYYTNLRPGSYRFELKAVDHRGHWSEAPAAFSFRLEPHFWQTWPFYALCGLAAMSLAGGFTAYRLRWQRRLLQVEQQQALANERTRIARDLHDRDFARSRPSHGKAQASSDHRRSSPPKTPLP